jgi:predicted ArsR family transcriptional regulator
MANIDEATFDRSVDELTATFGDGTRRAVYLFVRDHADGVTAAEVAAHAGVHPNVARHHLDKLAAAGFVEIADRADASGARSAGRPSKRYVATAKQVAVSMPFRDDRLLVDLLLTTLTTMPADRAESMAEAAGRQYGRRLAAAAGDPDAAVVPSRHEMLTAVAAALTGHGFDADADVASDEIVARNCPFGEIAEQFPHVVCALDNGMVQGMLEGMLGGSDAAPDTQRTASRPRGDDACVTRVAETGTRPGS